MARILGIGGLDHNGSICIVEDGALTSFSELERVNRQKNSGIKESKDIELLLEHLSIDSVDHVAVGDLYWWRQNEYWLRPWIENRFPTTTISIFHHHLCHLSIAFFLSPYEDSIAIAIDGKGDSVATSWTLANRSLELKMHGAQSSKFSLGRLWWAFSEACGFPGHHSAGKTMAYASLGTSQKFLLSILRWDDLEFSLEHEGMTQQDWREIDKIQTWCERLLDQGVFSSKFDMAAELQELTIQIGTHLATELVQRTGVKNICLAGGVALNGLMNQAISELDAVEGVFVPPITDDRGLSIGAAFLAAFKIGDPISPSKRFSPYTGPLMKVSQGFVPVGFEEFQSDRDVFHNVADILSNDGLVAWHQGRSEAGPRALCHRSLLATPTKKNLSERINSEVKHREWFRPFGCSLRAEDAHEWLMFEGDSPYMLRIVKVNPMRTEEVAGIVHLDGTTRPHLVTENELPELHKILSILAQSGYPPMVLNTSLNRRGEPLSETVQDTFEIALAMNVDAVYIDGRLWKNTRIGFSLEEKIHG